MTLAGVLTSAEHLTRLLTARSCKALWSTNQELRQLVCSRASTLLIRHQASIDLLLRPSWPHLTTLKLSNTNIGANHVRQLVQAELPALQALDPSANTLTSSAVEQLVTGNWQHLANLDLASSLPGTDDVAACHCLAASNWPALGALNISKNMFTAAAITELVEADWPALQDLNVMACFEHLPRQQLIQATSMLANGHWPQLTALGTLLVTSSLLPWK